MKKRILTGNRPTGKLHLGHFVGTIENRLKMQDDYDTFLFIPDYHVFTTKPINELDLKRSAIDEVADNLACGIDPKKVTYYLQSDVPEVTELSLLFGMLMTVPRLEIVPSLKDMMRDAGIEKPSFGLLGYPVLMAADILLVKGEVVPVGKDNAANVEVSREIAQRFNHLYGQTFPVPELVVGYGGKILPGTDGNLKMGKSLGNAIFLSDGPAEVKRKVMSMYTDPNRIRPTDPGKVEGNPVFVYHETFNEDKDEVADLKARYEKGTVGDVEVKEKLYRALEKFLEPIRERRGKIKDSDVADILADGAKKAKPIARETVAEARAAMKIPNFG